MGGILLEWTTEQFLTFVSKLKYNPTELEASRKALNYAGFFVYSDILTMDENQIYESRLYEGYACKWKDIFDEWVFKTTNIKKIEDICHSLVIDKGKAYLAICKIHRN